MSVSVEKKNFEIKKAIQEIISSDEATVALVLLVVAITILDFYSHPNGFVADPERRSQVMQIIGSLSNYIGNYGISACLGAAAVVAKNFMKKAFHSEIAHKMIHGGHILVASLIIDLNLLIEIFNGNNHPVQDVSAGLIGLGMGTLAMNQIIKKVREKRAKKNKAI